ncbi:MAG: LEA type 2 family protein [Candidatus Riflebacteria bacterium]|nr:LEA type 2 family protein [Candidatus Riflebacteria bacterium]
MAGSKKKSGGIIGFFKKVLLLLFLLVLSVAGLLYYQRNNLQRWASKCILLKPAKMNINLASLVGAKQMTGTIDLSVYSYFPFGINLMSLDYSLNLNGIIVAKGAHNESKTYIAPMATTTVELSFNLDRVNTSAALAKTVPQKLVQTADSILDQLKGKENAKKMTLRDVARITGKADFRLIAGSFEIPMDAGMSFQRNM